MKITNLTGAAGAVLALLLACGEASTAEHPESEHTARAAAAADHDHDGHDAHAADSIVAAEHADPDHAEHVDRDAKTTAATAEHRLRPGMERLETGVDLSTLPQGAEGVPPAEAPSPPDPATAERQGGRITPDAQPQATQATQGTQGTQGDTGELPVGHATILGEGRHDFGPIVQGTHAEHTFRLVSDGDNDLVISRIKPSCGCTVANVNLVQPDGSRAPYATGAPIPPGSEFEIEAAFKSDGKQGKTRTQVAVYCNDPRTVLSLMLEAEVQPVLVLEPRTLNLGSLTSAEVVEGTMRLSSPTLPAYALEVDKQFIQKNMSVELEPVDPDAEGKAKQWDVHVTLGPGLPEGMRNYPIRLTTDQLIPSPRDVEGVPKHYFVIGYTQVQVQGIVSANPAYVPFGMVRPGTVVERVVRIVCHDDFPLSPDVPVQLTALIQKDVFDYNKSFTTHIDPVEGKNALDLTVRLEGLPDDASGSFGGMLKLEIGHPSKKELLVRFSGVCRPGIPPQGSGSGQ